MFCSFRATKVWYDITPASRDTLQTLAASDVYNTADLTELEEDARAAVIVKSTMVVIGYIGMNAPNARLYRVVQDAGTFLYRNPGAYHRGFK